MIIEYSTIGSKGTIDVYKSAINRVFPWPNSRSHPSECFWIVPNTWTDEDWL